MAPTKRKTEAKPSFENVPTTSVTSSSTLQETTKPVVVVEPVPKAKKAKVTSKVKPDTKEEEPAPVTSSNAENGSSNEKTVVVEHCKVTSQSSGPSLRPSIQPELKMRLQEAFDDLVSHNMLDLTDVAHAESYLYKSTWASSIFLRQEDLGKRAAMIINARKNPRGGEEEEKEDGGRKY